MGSELCANGLGMEGTISSNFVPICVITKVDSPVVEDKNVRTFPQASTLAFDQRPTCIGRPVSPDFDRANAEQCLDRPSQDLLVSSPCSVRRFDFNDNGSETPKESIFDPFSLVHDKFMLAPPRKKCMEESGNNIVRRLDFSSFTNLVSRDFESYDDTKSEEEQMLAIVCSDLLDVITSERTKEFATTSLSGVSDSDGFCTPKFAARLSGIAETCPGAPKKSIHKYRNIDKNLCRKLEY
ncbi:hypothetical protein F511_14068 [Dorcoceras hygrometricum]|uniref:Uncharacterized protein n=1 Tax=Dorcoceras hygrometricum TaxID=472368 RepID=A0A2Z7C2M4_9LAMI|nr:hypothetical protein F511_14068 [Dorcoceras hygrometricum]